MYDPAIGRFTSVDPLADFPTVVSSNPYNYVLNNPMINIDPDGRLVINGHSAQLEKDRAAFKEAQSAFNSTSKDTDKKAFKKARKNLKSAERKFNSTKASFDRVNEKIELVKNGSSELFENADNLKDAGGNNVDIYVYDEDHEGLQEGRYGDGVAVFGDTDANFGSQVNRSNGFMYMKVTSKRHKDNVTIRISSQSSARQLAHEFGHAIYQTEKTLEYFNWLKRNPEQQGKGGHGEGDPSGAAAVNAEKNFKFKRN